MAGAGYYVDALAGNDSNPGTFVAPWKSLSRLGAVTLLKGEAIYLRCGSVWRESLVLGRTQLVDGSSIASYGADCSALNKPRITASNDFSGGWTKIGNVWSRSVGLSTPKIEALAVAGSLARVAQWPNFGGAGHEYALAAGVATASSHNLITLNVADAAALAGKDLVGAKIQVRTEPWTIEKQSLKSLVSGVATLNASTVYPINSGDGFVLQDKLWMVDAPGEFFHDTASGMLYVYPATAAAQANLNSVAVEATVRDVAAVISGRAKLTIKNLRFDMARNDGLMVNDAPEAVIDGVDAGNNLWAGVRVNLQTMPAAPARGATIRGGVFGTNALAGVDAGGALGVDVLSNTVTGTGMAHAGLPEAAIVIGDGGLVQGNLVDQSAFRGIIFSSFGGTRVMANTVSGYCLRLSDCAAIYTFNGNGRVSGIMGATVEANRVGGAAPNYEGNASGHLVIGIYLDDLSKEVAVRNNVLTGMPIGIFLHNSSNNLVQDNKVWLTTDTGLLFSMDNLSVDLGRGNTFQRNQFAPASLVTGTYPALPQIKSTQAIRFLHAMDGTGSLSSGTNLFVGNQVVPFNGDTNVMAAVGRSGTTAWLTAASWKALNPTETPPSSPATFAIYRSTLGAELLNGGGFDSGLGAWTSYFAPAAIPGSLTLVNGVAGCVGPCARLVAGNVNDRLESPLFRMVPGAQYMISFTAAFGALGDIPHPDIARPTYPYDSFIDAQGLRSPNTTLTGQAGGLIRYEAFFTATSSDSARINLHIGTNGVPVNYDSISLRPVVGYAVSNFADWGAVVEAPMGSAKTVSCTDLGWPTNCGVIDIDGNLVSMPATLAAGTTRLLLLGSSNWRL